MFRASDISTDCAGLIKYLFFFFHPEFARTYCLYRSLECFNRTLKVLDSVACLMSNGGSVVLVPYYSCRRFS